MTVKYSQLITAYGNANRAAAELGFTRQALSKWKKKRRIPDLSQVRIQLRTNGRFRANLAMLAQKRVGKRRGKS